MSNQKDEGGGGDGCFIILIILIFFVLIPFWSDIKGLIEKGIAKNQEVAKQKETHTIEGVVEKVQQGDDGFTVFFKDGRSRTFSKVSSKPIEPGKYWLIEYNGVNEITDVKPKED